MKKYFLPLGVLGIFMTIAVTLWLTQDNIFYLFNFSYIGISIFFGIIPAAVRLPKPLARYWPQMCLKATRLEPKPNRRSIRMLFA